MVKKQLIMEKSLELFVENGFESTSVQQITERCGISKGAFYLHFKSKDELIYCLIDQFMSEFIADVERSVSGDTPPEELLYNFLHLIFSEFQKQANIAKLFMKEQVVSFNKDLLEKMQMYQIMFNRIILSVVQRQYVQTDKKMHLDIVMVINGLTKSYSELIFLDNYSVDLDKLCKSIVEKVSIIAQHANIHTITLDYFASTNHQIQITRESIIELINEVLNEIDDHKIVRESLVLLKEHLKESNLSEVLVQGLLKNIRTHTRCKWIAFLYQLEIEKEGGQ
ncbi:TetR family transcriptional regulator [Ureibacillus xyleni]|uniref:TetR family transcriptional regulator n=1 Tax=Ureibacillus xyleni TaxID=614648 RepID=A0A285SLC1_9BACL|nr:TetR/AcrR family transcriptional regulator [Ureibacillus xyleni]SOC08777.1 TetR family transcriptional regulator [Ureibacillus xyleni]